MSDKNEEYKEMFQAEALDSYEELNKLFGDLEKDNTNKRAVDAIFRITHTLKGNAMGMGFKSIAELGHIMEDIFSEVKSGKISLDSQLFSALFKANDKLGELIEAIKTEKKVSYRGIRTKLEVFLREAVDDAKEQEDEIKTEESPAQETDESKTEEVPEEKAKETSENKEDEKDSLYDRIGGKDALNAAVDIFYDKILADESISHFFKSTDMTRLKGSQRTFMAMAFGGPVNYSGKNMQDAHARLVEMGLTDTHFNTVFGHLVSTLQELKVPEELIAEAGVIVESTRKDVLAGSGETIVEGSEEDTAGRQEEKESLFVRIGGDEALNAAVDIFYDKVLADEHVSHFFKSADMSTLKSKQRSFLAMAMGGPVEYTGESMQQAHAKLVGMGLDDSHFNFVVNHLISTLQELKVAKELIDEVAEIVETTRKDVLAGKTKLVDKGIEGSGKAVEDQDGSTVEFQEEEDEEDEEVEEKTKITFSDLVQVPVRKLDGMLNLVGELIIERDRLIAMNNDDGKGSSDFTRLQRITSDLQYGVMDIRLVQIGFLFNKFHRIVRDVAAIEKKNIKLALEGTSNEIDRNILKIMSDSMIHLVRNAASHGIESAEVRKKAGKPAEGIITLKARNEKDTVYIDISDDGAGIDTKVIKKKAVEKGVLSKALADSMDESQIMMVIFEPGFSSVESITEVSGRGVGMDVVKKATESIGGKVSVTSDLGKGTTVTLALPSSMAVKGALLFEMAHQEFAIALTYTEAVISLTKKEIHKVSNGLMSTYLDKNISIVFLKDLFKIDSLKTFSVNGVLQESYNEIDEDKKLDILVVSNANKYVGFVVDKLLQQKEIVEKTLSKPLDNIELVSGVTILGNGNVCMVLDVVSIVDGLFKINVMKTQAVLN